MVVDNVITIDLNELSTKQWEALLAQLRFVNGKNEIVECYRQVYTRGQVQIPRGAWELVDQKYGLSYKDDRCAPLMPSLEFALKLDDVEKDPRFSGQSDAVAAMFDREQGQIIRAPGTGKTQIALKFIAECETTSLVIVHTEDILNQWIEYAQRAIPGIEIGVIRGRRCEIGHLTIATIQTIRNHIAGKKKSWWRQFGCVIADEAHHGSAATWEAVINWCPAYYRFGFTASPTRADGMHPALKWIFGPVIHKQKFSSAVDLKVKPVFTDFKYRYRGRYDWTPMLNALVTDQGRNDKIARIADREIDGGNSVLILSRRIEHLERIAEGMRGECEILTGARNKDDRKRIIAAFKDGSLPCLLSTQLADEALDVPRLNRVILTHPGKHEGRIIQQVGRAIREFPGKKDAVIYDIVDRRVGVLKHQWSQRKRTYRVNKITVKKVGRLIHRGR